MPGAGYPRVHARGVRDRLLNGAFYRRAVLNKLKIARRSPLYRSPKIAPRQADARLAEKKCSPTRLVTGSSLIFDMQPGELAPECHGGV